MKFFLVEHQLLEDDKLYPFLRDLIFWKQNEKMDYLREDDYCVCCKYILYSSTD